MEIQESQSYVFCAIYLGLIFSQHKEFDDKTSDIKCAVMNRFPSYVHLVPAELLSKYLIVTLGWFLCTIIHHG